MAKINVKSTKTTKVKNYEGGEAYELSPEMKLLNLSSTCLFKEPKFYGKVGDIEEDIFKTIDVVAKKDPKFILQLATYLRTELYLRTISIVMLTRAANIINCKPYVHRYTQKIIQRADEITEALAYHIQAYGQQHPDDPEKTIKKIPNSLKKGIADSFKKFDRYNFRKYDRKRQVTFKDAIMLTHPKEPSEIIKEILDEKLPKINTWETIISEKGSTKESWEEVIDTWIPNNS